MMPNRFIIDCRLRCYHYDSWALSLSVVRTIPSGAHHREGQRAHLAVTYA